VVAVSGVAFLGHQCRRKSEWKGVRGRRREGSPSGGEEQSDAALSAGPLPPTGDSPFGILRTSAGIAFAGVNIGAAWRLAAHGSSDEPPPPRNL